MKNLYVVTNTSQQIKGKSFLNFFFGSKKGVKLGANNYLLRSYTTGMPGSGAGKGGGAGGAVRESGGSLGQYGAVQEDSYFFKKQKEQLKQIKKKLDSGESVEWSQKKEDK